MGCVPDVIWIADTPNTQGKIYTNVYAHAKIRTECVKAWLCGWLLLQHGQFPPGFLLSGRTHQHSKTERLFT
jgi:hypothetical protein